MSPHHRSVLRLVFIAAAVVMFVCGLHISIGHSVFGSHNADAFRYVGLAFLALALVP